MDIVGHQIHSCMRMAISGPHFMHLASWVGTGQRAYMDTNNNKKVFSSDQREYEETKTSEDKIEGKVKHAMQMQASNAASCNDDLFASDE